MALAVACASGGYRVAFVQGVLSALERANIKADAYAGTSGSVIPAALAAVGQHEQYGLAYLKGLKDYKSLGKGMSGVFLESIRFWEPLISRQLWQPGKPRLIVPVSAVVTPEAAEQTQGTGARHLGRNLLRASVSRDSSWVAAHLNMELFDSQAAGPRSRLTPENFKEVAYASSRMLHAWDIPAWIEGRPYIDGSYTCCCPALELAAMGYDEVIAISPEHGPFYHDLFGTDEIPPTRHETSIRAVQPDVDLQTLGVNYTQTTESGLRQAYRHGEEKGLTFLEEWRQSIDHAQS